MATFYWVCIVSVLWVTLLALNVSRIRIKEKVGIGDGGRLAIKKATRAHINALEHTIPFCVLAYPLTAIVSENVLLGLSVVFFASRLLHAYSFYASSDPLRQISAGITYLALLGGTVIGIVALV